MKSLACWGTLSLDQAFPTCGSYMGGFDVRDEKEYSIDRRFHAVQNILLADGVGTGGGCATSCNTSSYTTTNVLERQFRCCSVSCNTPSIVTPPLMSAGRNYVVWCLSQINDERKAGSCGKILCRRGGAHVS